MREKLSQKLIGYRVKAARDARGWTQEQVAQGLGLNDRQSISDIENGKRALKPDELLQLSDLLDHDIDYFLDPFAIAGEANFSWRAPPEIAEDKLHAFELKTGRWIGLLRWLRAQQDNRPSVLKSTLRLSAQSSFEDAQECAESLSIELNLGIIPAEALLDKIENKLGIPVLFVDVVTMDHDKSISGATCHLEDMNVILINRHETEGRRFYDLAHELFHALTWDAMKPEHRESNAMEQRHKPKRIEQLADNFAAALLMPLTSIDQLIAHDRQHDIRHLSAVATRLRVTPLALAWRLYNLKRIDSDTREHLGKQRAATGNPPQQFSIAFVRMLHDALEHGRVSARKVAKTMELELEDLTALFAEYDLAAPFEL